MVLYKTGITKALIRLCGCAGWSAPVLFANPRRQVFLRRGTYLLSQSLFLFSDMENESNSLRPFTAKLLKIPMSTQQNQGQYTRGIWKVLSMVLYLSTRFTNPIMFGIILKNYLSSILWHKFHEDIIMQTRKILVWIHVLFVYWKMQNFSRKCIILPFEKCAEH